MSSKEIPSFIQEIKAALGKREIKPITIWYIPPENADEIDLSALDSIAHEPSLISEILRLQSGGILIVVTAARTSADELEQMLLAIGWLYGIQPGELV